MEVEDRRRSSKLEKLVEACSDVQVLILVIVTGLFVDSGWRGCGFDMSLSHSVVLLPLARFQNCVAAVQ